MNYISYVNTEVLFVIMAFLVAFILIRKHFSNIPKDNLTYDNKVPVMGIGIMVLSVVFIGSTSLQFTSPSGSIVTYIEYTTDVFETIIYLKSNGALQMV